MNLKAAKNAITSRFGRQILKGRKHAPVILFVAGAVGVVGATVLACRATLKMEEVLDEIQIDLDKARALEHPNYSDTDRQKDLALIYLKGTGRIFTMYAPALGLGVLSILALTGSHVILTKRNAAVVAAYAALDKGFREYRNRVMDELGADKDREFRYGVIEREIVEETEEGPVVKRVKQIGPGGSSIYARFFDEHAIAWNKDPFYNQMFIQCQQNYANDLLQARGHVLLNDVYDMLKFPRTKEGCVVGWVKDDGDGYIDFGVFHGDRASGMRFVQGNERSIHLDFNVDGMIYDKI